VLSPVRRGKTNFAVRNCRIFHLKALDHLALLIVFFVRRHSSQQLNTEEIRMNNKVLSCLIAGALSTALALAPPALARGGGGGGGHGGGWGGGMHGGGWSGGMRGGGWSGGMRAGMPGGWGGNRAVNFSGSRFAGTHFSGSRFAGRQFAHSRFAFRDHRFHHRFHRFAFVGSYAAYDGCWQRTWTPYGLRWVNVCGDYGYY
jgi:hypothetical protein